MAEGVGIIRVVGRYALSFGRSLRCAPSQTAFKSVPVIQSPQTRFAGPEDFEWQREWDLNPR